MQVVKDIIARRKTGIDCSEAESAEIKQWLINTVLLVGSEEIALCEDIQQTFPQEYGEAMDYLEEQDKQEDMTEELLQKAEFFAMADRMRYHG